MWWAAILKYTVVLSQCSISKKRAQRVLTKHSPAPVPPAWTAEARQDGCTSRSNSSPTLDPSVDCSTISASDSLHIFVHMTRVWRSVISSRTSQITLETCQINIWSLDWKLFTASLLKKFCSYSTLRQVNEWKSARFSEQYLDRCWNTRRVCFTSPPLLPVCAGTPEHIHAHRHSGSDASNHTPVLHYPIPEKKENDEG